MISLLCRRQIFYKNNINSHCTLVTGSWLLVAGHWSLVLQAEASAVDCQWASCTTSEFVIRYSLVPSPSPVITPGAAFLSFFLSARAFVLRAVNSKTFPFIGS